MSQREDARRLITVLRMWVDRNDVRRLREILDASGLDKDGDVKRTDDGSISPHYRGILSDVVRNAAILEMTLDAAEGIGKQPA